MDAARRLLLKAGDLSFPEALSQARRLVHGRWGEIERVARALHARADLDSAQVRAAVRAR